VSVYLADLRHTYMGVLSSDAMPLNVGYMKAVMDRDLPDVDARLFAYADRLLEALKTDPPNVLMLSNYTWNEYLALHCARVAKQIRPETLVVLGGPNVPDEPERQMDYVTRHPDLDMYVLGEGDFLATEIVQRFIDVGMSIDKLQHKDIPSSVYTRADEGVVWHEIKQRQRNLDDIPSPWLTGVMDEFFDGRLAPMWETNRGCPFTCTFCVQGTKYYNRVTYFDKARLKEEIDYIGRQIRDRSPSIGVLRIADPNYGMYRRDPELSGYIGEAQKEYGWPTYVDATTGKNRPERVIESMEATSGALVLYQSVQSLDEEVLRNIKRENIKLEAYEALAVHMRGRGLKSSSDLILGLPGETLESHLNSLMSMIDTGVSRVQNFQCLLLKGTELERQDSRDQFKFKTAFRAAQKSFGVYEDEAVFEVEEIIVATDTLPFEDYLKARVYHFVCGIFINHGLLETVFCLAQALGIKRSELFANITQAIEEDKGEIGTLLEHFLDETRNELFDTREELVEFYGRPENLAMLTEGTIGDNVIYKYSAIANLRTWKAFCQLALAVSRKTFLEYGAREQIPGFDRFWKDFGKFLLLRFATGSTLAHLTSTISATMSYDIGRWIEDGCAADVRPYRLAQPLPAEFRLSNEHSREITQAVDVWGLSHTGAGMLLRRVSFSTLERDIVLHPALS